MRRITPRMAMVSDSTSRMCILLLVALSAVSLSIAMSLVSARPPQPSPQPLKLYERNIIETEPDGTGRLRVWGYDNGIYTNIWGIASVHYDYVATGIVDGSRAIVATSACSVQGGYKVFYDLYKEGKAGASSSEGVIESKIYWMNEITIEGDETVMITPHWLVVYDSAGQIRSKWASSGCQLRSLAIADIDGDGGKEIVVAANDEMVENRGYLLFFEYAQLVLTPEIVPVPSIGSNGHSAKLGDDSLHVGDLDGDGQPEIVSTGYYETMIKLPVRKPAYVRYTESYVLVWRRTPDGWTLISKVVVPLTDQSAWLHADIGVLQTGAGMDIVVSIQGYCTDLIVYRLEASAVHDYRDREDTIAEIGRTNFTHSGQAQAIVIADSDNDGVNEVTVSGYGPGSFLQVLSYGQTSMLETEWLRIQTGEYGVWEHTIG